MIYCLVILLDMIVFQMDLGLVMIFHSKYKDGEPVDLMPCLKST